MPTIFLTAGAGTNQTWTVPQDWSERNIVECIGGAGSGGGSSPALFGGGCGGGGAFSIIVNLTGIFGGGTVIYRCGTVAGDTWFNSVAFPATGQA